MLFLQACITREVYSTNKMGHALLLSMSGKQSCRHGLLCMHSASAAGHIYLTHIHLTQTGNRPTASGAMSAASCPFLL